MFTFAKLFAHLSDFSGKFARQDRFDHLFSLSESQLKRRGLDRDALVRSYITGLAKS